jgi:hypothetical protein
MHCGKMDKFGKKKIPQMKWILDHPKDTQIIFSQKKKKKEHIEESDK